MDNLLNTDCYFPNATPTLLWPLLSLNAPLTALTSPPCSSDKVKFLLYTNEYSMCYEICPSSNGILSQRILPTTTIDVLKNNPNSLILFCADPIALHNKDWSQVEHIVLQDNLFLYDYYLSNDPTTSTSGSSSGGGSSNREGQQNIILKALWSHFDKAQQFYHKHSTIINANNNSGWRRCYELRPKADPTCSSFIRSMGDVGRLSCVVGVVAAITPPTGQEDDYGSDDGHIELFVLNPRACEKTNVNNNNNNTNNNNNNNNQKNSLLINNLSSQHFKSLKVPVDDDPADPTYIPMLPPLGSLVLMCLTECGTYSTYYPLASSKELRFNNSKSTTTTLKTKPLRPAYKTSIPGSLSLGMLDLEAVICSEKRQFVAELLILQHDLTQSAPDDCTPGTVFIETYLMMLSSSSGVGQKEEEEEEQQQEEQEQEPKQNNVKMEENGDENAPREYNNINTIRNDIVELLKQQLLVKDEQIATHHQQLDLKDKQLAEKDAQLAKKEKQVQMLLELLASKE